MDSCYVPNNPAYTDCWRPLSPTCGQAPILMPLRPLTAPSPPLHPPPAYPPARSPEPPTCQASEFAPARTPTEVQDPLYLTTTPTSVPHPPLMGSTFPPLFDQLEPLPNFVTLSPHAPYNREVSNSMLGKEKGDHMADVLLSLKHAVVHPHQVGESSPPPPPLTPPMMPPTHPPLPPFHPPPSYSPSSYPQYPHTPTYLPLAPLTAPSPPPESSSITESVLPPSISSPSATDPHNDPHIDPHNDPNMDHHIDPHNDALHPHPPSHLDESVALPDAIGASSPPSSLPSSLGMSGCTLSFGAPLGSSIGSLGSSLGSIGGPLPPMVSSGYSSPISSSLCGPLGGPLLPPPPSMSPYSPYQQTQTLPSMMGGMGGGSCYATGGYQDPSAYVSSAPPPPPHVFPAMSVNVSMNMTMGVSNVNMGYSPEQSLQHQWSTGCPGSQVSSVSPVSGMGYPQHSAPGLVSPLPMSYSGSCSQSYGVGSYSWAGDIRPEHPPMTSLDRDLCLRSPPLRPKPGSPCVPYLNSTPSQCGQLSPTLSALRRRPSLSGVVGVPGMCTNTNSLDISKPLLSDSLKPNLCRICGRTYARPSTLKTHLRTHSGEKPYRCDECNKCFSQAANLTAHVRTHSGEKPFRCPICDRRFSQSSSVTTHMRTHSGERPYRCRMCKKAFSDSSTLTKHLRIHSGEKPYQCKLCLLRFSQSGNLNRHMRVHSQTS